MDVNVPTPMSSSLPPEITPEVAAHGSHSRPTGITKVLRLPKRRRTFIITGVALLVAIGVILAYNLWYQNPQKVITDGLAQAIAAKSVSYTAVFDAVGSNTAKISVDGNALGGQQSGNATLSLSSAGKSYAIKGNVVLDKTNTVYFKLTNVNDLVKPYKAALPEKGRVLLDQLATKLGSNWIKLSATDLQNYNSGLATTQRCTTSAVNALQGDKAAAAELADVYKKHQFITIDKKLGSKNGSLGYQISADKKTSQAFAHDLQTTAIYKALHKCNPQFSASSMTDFFGDTSGQTTIYVSRFAHQITSLSMASKDSRAKTSATFTIAPKFNVPVTITVPTKTTTVAQLLSDLQSVLQSANKP